MDHDTIITDQVIGCAIEVHRDLGPGLLENPYHRAMCVELTHRRIAFDTKRTISLEYRGVPIGEYIPDLIVGDKVIVEIKSSARFDDLFTAQMLTYLRLTRLHVGLIINFNNRLLKDGIKRVVF